MTTYSITAPNGKTYSIDGPPGATQAQVQAEVARRDPDAAKPAPKPSFWQQAGKATKNALGAVAEGVANVADMPIDQAISIARPVIGGMTAAGGAVLDATGHRQGANALRQAGENTKNNLEPYRGLSTGGVHRVAPGVEGMNPLARFAYNMVGGAMIPGPKTAAAPRGLPARQLAALSGEKAAHTEGSAVSRRAPAAQAETEAANRQIIASGKREGIEVLTTDLLRPKTAIGRSAQRVGELIPFAGTGGRRASQMQNRIAAVHNVVDEYGSAAAHDMGDAVDNVAADLVKTRGGMLTKLKAAKSAVIERIPGIVPVDRTVSEIDRQVAWLNGINADAYKPVVSELESFKANLLSGKTLSQIEGNRRILGDMFKDANLAKLKTDGQTAINAIYAPLRAEMGTFIANRGDKGDLQRWRSANDQLAAMAGEIESKAFRNVLNDAETTPEAAARLLFSKTPSDVQKLSANLSHVGKSNARAALLYKGLESASKGNEVSPQLFAKAMETMDKNTGTFFAGPDKARLDGFTRMLKATQRASEAAASPPTGAQNTPFILGFSLKSVFGGAALPVTGAIGLVARAYESAPVRDALIKLGRTKPGSPQEAVMIDRAGSLISAFVAASSRNVKGVANDMVGVPAAAGDRPEDQQQQQPAPQP